MLRRPQAKRDQLPAASKDALATDGLRRIYTRYVRRVGTIANGDPYFLVAATLRTRPARSCMKRLSPRRRARQRRLAKRLERTLLLWLDDFKDGGGDYGVTAADAIAGKAFASADGPEPPNSTDTSQIPVSVSVLAPDGAASVEARYPGEPPITAPIDGNYATFEHMLHIKPDATHFPNFNPDVATFKRADGSVLLQSHPFVDAPAFGGE